MSTGKDKESRELSFFRETKQHPLNHEFLSFISGLSEGEAFSALYNIFLNIDHLNLNAVRLSTWHYRVKEKFIFESALKKAIDDLPEVSAKQKLALVLYKHLSREMKFEEAISFSFDRKDVYNIYRQKQVLFRSYILSQVKVPDFARRSLREPQILIEEVIPRFKDEGLVNELRKLSTFNQLASIGKGTYKESFVALARKEILQEIESCEDKFAESLMRIVNAASVAIVLKGPSISKRELGYLVDSHELVIRVNFPKHDDRNIYGAKTDILYYAPFLREKADSTLSKESDVGVEFLPTNGDFERRNKKIRSVISAVSYESATTGFSLIVLATILCNGSVSVFGFDSYSPVIGDYASMTESERMKAIRVRDLAGPAHEIDYENWYVHSFLKRFVSFKNLSLI